MTLAKNDKRMTLASCAAIGAPDDPDAVDVEVDVITLWPGHAAEEVERPLTISLGYWGTTVWDMLTLDGWICMYCGTPCRVGKTDPMPRPARNSAGGGEARSRPSSKGS